MLVSETSKMDDMSRTSGGWQPVDIDNESIAKIQEAFEATTSAIAKLTSDNEAEMATGALEMITALSPLAGPKGMIIACLSSLASGIPANNMTFLKRF